MIIACLQAAESDIAVFEAAARKLGLSRSALSHEIRSDLRARAEQAGCLSSIAEATEYREGLAIVALAPPSMAGTADLVSDGLKPLTSPRAGPETAVRMASRQAEARGPAHPGTAGQPPARRSSGRLGSVHGFHPANSSPVPDRLDTDITERTDGTRSVPVALVRTEPDAVARPDFSDGAAVVLNQTHAVEHEQHLPARMAMPVGDDTRIEIDPHRGHFAFRLAGEDRLHQERATCHTRWSRSDPIPGSPDCHRGWTGGETGPGCAHSTAPAGFAAQTPEANDQSASVESAMTIMTSSGRMPTVPERSSTRRL